ncbi:hypothetical protein CO046_02710 [Candidatus Peregrinibacteria bacterium CG_4_9_14_0_2_um_filter_53_11]|nr:MAG: hypothetical protein CO046_02710 [Candidatus Peregrinibacteria bacterium CG_4_9_14_0_2_um_filter_53_11]
MRFFFFARAFYALLLRIQFAPMGSSAPQLNRDDRPQRPQVAQARRPEEGQSATKMGEAAGPSPFAAVHLEIQSAVDRVNERAALDSFFDHLQGLSTELFNVLPPQVRHEHEDHKDLGSDDCFALVNRLAAQATEAAGEIREKVERINELLRGFRFKDEGLSSMDELTPSEGVLDEVAEQVVGYKKAYDLFHSCSVKYEDALAAGRKAFDKETGLGDEQSLGYKIYRLEEEVKRLKRGLLGLGRLSARSKIAELEFEIIDLKNLQAALKVESPPPSQLRVTEPRDLYHDTIKDLNHLTHPVEDYYTDEIDKLEELEAKLETARSAGEGGAVKGLTGKKAQLTGFHEVVREAVQLPAFVKALLSYDKKDNPLTTAALRELLVTFSHELNPDFGGEHEGLPDEITHNAINYVTNYIGDLVLTEGVKALNLDKTQQKRLSQIFSLNALTDERQRLEAHASKGTKKIAAIPSRGPMAELSGYYGDACWTSRDDIVKNNPDMIGLAFVSNPGDAVHENLMGSCLLFERTIGGEKTLIVRGLNPRQNYITQLNAESFLKEFVEYLKPIAQARGIASIVAPMNTPGALTNRPTISRAFDSLYGETPLLELDEPLTFNGYTVTKVTELVRF